jgi:chemotaxis protein CheZ
MPVQRNVFRIEQLGHPSPRSSLSAADAESALRHNEIMTELKLLRALLEGSGADSPTPPATDTHMFKGELHVIYEAIRRTKQEIATLHVSGFDRREMGRVSRELNAMVGGSETATHRILQAGEEIEEIATTLSAALNNMQDRDLARDIQDHVTRIFEACNFQDLAGQRVTKVIATLKFIEDHILRMMEIWGGIEQFRDIVPEAKAERQSHPQLINGPKLDGDRGYVSQREIDEMFAAGLV